MIGIQRRTFKQLQDEVLSWMGDEGDTGALLTLVKYAIKNSHEKRLTSGRFSFMLHPKEFSFTSVVGQSSYSLHDAFHTPLHFYFSDETDNFLIEVPYSEHFKQLPTEGMKRFHLHGISPVLNQPPSGGSTVNASVDLTGDQTVLITGDTATGTQEETLTSADRTGNVVFTTIYSVRKNNTSTAFSGTITLTYATGGATALALPAALFGRQYRQFTFLAAPTEVRTIKYRFFFAPRPLENNNDIPNTPHPFDRIHVLDALLDLVGYTRATPQEVKRWEEELALLEQDMIFSYQEGMSMNAEASYTELIAR